MRNGRWTKEGGRSWKRQEEESGARAKRKNAAKHGGEGSRGGSENSKSGGIRESYFNILSALRGITHTHHEWTANIWNGPQTWRSWSPCCREKGKRIVFEGGQKVLLCCFSLRFDLLGWKCMGTGYRPILTPLVSIYRLVPYPRVKGKKSGGKMDGIAIIRVNCTATFRISSFPTNKLRGTRSRRTTRKSTCNFFFFDRGKFLFF